MIFWNQSTVNVTNQSIFSVRVNISNVDFLATGQFDVFYNRSVLNVRSPLPGAGSVDDTYDRTVWGEPDTGCGWQSITELTASAQDVGYGTNIANSSCFRVFWTNNWAQTGSFEGDCAGGDGYGQTGDGWITLVTFRAVGPGTSNISFGSGPGGKLQVNQVVNWDDYQDYSYDPSIPLVWGANVSVTVQ